MCKAVFIWLVLLAVVLSPLAITSCHAASVQPIWTNDNVANSLSFNDTFGHSVVVGTYNASTGVWSGSVGGGGAASFSTLAVSGLSTLGTTGGITGEIDFKGSTSGTAILKPNAVAGTPTITLPVATGTIALGVIGKVTYQPFTASGTYTPNANMITAVVYCIGGGSGGGGATSTVTGSSAGGGGGGGGFSIATLTAAAIGASKTVTIGAGGSAGASGGSDGGAGGDTSLGTLCIGKGATSVGTGGATQSGANGGLGGVPGTGDTIFAGNDGGPSTAAPTNAVEPVPGYGASGPQGGGVNTRIAGGAAAAIAGRAGGNYGAGGSAGWVFATASGAAGGAGKAGVIMIWEFNSQ